MDLNATTYTGAWINWSRGQVLGATLTLSKRPGAALIAAVTIFVQLAGTCSWIAICYIIHQCRTKQAKADGLYHQQQVVLRNATSEIGVLWQLFKLGYAWHNITPRARRRMARFASVALFHLVLFLLAGIFSSQVIQTDRQTLVKPGSCGFMYQEPSADLTLSGFDEYVAVYLDIQRNAQISLQQVQNCNGGINSADVQCDVFSHAVKWSTWYGAPCPFADSSMCISSDGLAMQLDTGLIDSQHELGINAPTKDRIQFRHVSTCSPLKQEGFVTGWFNASTVNTTGMTIPLTPPPGMLIKFYDYGGAHGLSHTFWVSNWWEYTSQPGVNDLPAYQLGVTLSRGDDLYQPVSNLTSGDSDLALFFLQARLEYLDEVDDPWFSAHQPGVHLSGGVDPNVLRTPDNTAGVLGCIHQYQTCNTNSSCSPLMSFPNILQYTLEDNVLGFNEAQLNTSQRIFQASEYSNPDSVVGPLGASVLLANNDLVGDVSLPIPDNQWQLEMVNLHEILITTFQRSVLEYATGPQWDIRQYVSEPPTPIAKQQCNSQIMRRNDYMNFSILAVVLIAVAGFLLLLLYVCLEPAIRKQQQKTRNGQLRNLRWEKDGVLQLQRIAYQANDLGAWKAPQYSLVPVTTSAELFDFPEADDLYTGTPDEELTETEETKPIFTVKRKPLSGTASRENTLLFSNLHRSGTVR